MHKLISFALVLICIVAALFASWQNDYARGAFWLGLAIINQINALDSK